MRRRLAVATTLLVVAMLALGAGLAIAGKSSADPMGAEDGIIEATQEQLKLLQDIWGTPMTIAEYLETVYPEELEKILKELPADLAKHLYETKFEWGEAPKVPPTAEGADKVVQKTVTADLMP
ncbi:MAG: hypothetical protein IBX68_10215 [Dehalococcoidia bacterium]|nr:hypothetical protein [Dehalococcoidia bacterium]